MKNICSLVGWMVVALVAAMVAADAPPAAEKKPESPPTATVSRGALAPKAQLDAVFESTEMAPVKLEPKAWMDLLVLEVAPHGARVKKGETLVKLDTEKLKEQVEDLEKDQSLATLALEIAQAELENLAQTTPQRLEAARRFDRIANEDLSYFERTGREQREKAARFNVKSSDQRLLNAREELKQLEKMYRKDDLTEETEEIVLKRQKFTVESAEYSLEATKQNTDLSLNTHIPREAESLRAGKRDQDLALTLAEETLPKTLARKRLDVEKLKRDQKKSEKRLADLRHDLDALNVRAPMEGVVYYGACENGRWMPNGVVEYRKLAPGERIIPRKVFMTVVNADKLLLRAVVGEGDLAKLKRGMEGHAVPASAPDQKLAVKLEEITLAPLPTGGFLATLSAQKSDGLMPGMTAKVSLGESGSANSLLAPKEAVFAEGNHSVVFRHKAEGAPEKRTVKTGESDGKMIEILEGAAEGDKLLLKKPE